MTCTPWNSSNHIQNNLKLIIEKSLTPCAQFWWVRCGKFGHWGCMLMALLLITIWICGSILWPLSCGLDCFLLGEMGISGGFTEPCIHGTPPRFQTSANGFLTTHMPSIINPKTSLSGPPSPCTPSKDSSTKLPPSYHVFSSTTQSSSGSSKSIWQWLLSYPTTATTSQELATGPIIFTIKNSTRITVAPTHHLTGYSVHLTMAKLSGWPLRKPDLRS